MISTLDEYLDEIIAYENGKPITRRSTIPIPRINFLREHWSAAVGYGYRKAVRDGPKAAARAHPSVKLPKGVMP